MHHWFELEPMSIFHTINAWQEGDVIRMYTCYTPQVRGLCRRQCCCFRV